MSKTLLTVNEAAKFLKVSPNVIQEMINDKVFKATKAGNTQKINKDEIDEWLAKLNENGAQALALKKAVCRFQDYFVPENIMMNFEAEHKFEAIAKMSTWAKELKLVRDHRWLYEVVVAREELVSTAVGKGVALLHPRHHHPSKIKKPSILFGRCMEGVEFDAPDNKPVTLFFMLLLHNDKQHLFSLSYISKFILKDENIQALIDAENAEDIVHLLTLNQ
ncbi:MAG: PTS sugar transporter subunit IIA [Candidatus Cloacimonas sp.]|nr:PTS sugar transporter subunit IIA [Candidatus Cloacimonadota bacterium]